MMIVITMSTYAWMKLGKHHYVDVNLNDDNHHYVDVGLVDDNHHYVDVDLDDDRHHFVDVGLGEDEQASLCRRRLGC